MSFDYVNRRNLQFSSITFLFFVQYHIFMNRKREAYDRLAVGDRIRKKRVQLGFSQDEVAKSICDPAFEIIYCIYADFVESVIMNHVPDNIRQIFLE